MALYLAKKNANKVVNQVVGVEKVGAAKKSTGKPPPVSKKLKSGAPVKEVHMLN